MKRARPLRILTGLILFLSAACSASAGQTAQTSPASRPVSAQQTANPDNPSGPSEGAQAIKVRVNLVQVKVVVRDAKGQPVKDLKRDDFQIYDNGKPQMISSFSVETPETLHRKAQEAQKAQPREVPAPVEQAAMPQRYVALLFDDVHLETWDVLAVRAGAQKLIESMRPNDRIGIFSTSGLMTQEFTNDQEALIAKLKSLSSRPIVGKVNTSSTCPEVNYYMADQAINQHNSEILQTVTEEILECDFRNDPKMAGAARSMAESMLRQQWIAGNADNEVSYRQMEDVVGEISWKPGERVIILVSPGFLLANLYSEETGVIERANRAGVPINCLDARGLFSPAAAGHDISKPMADTQVASDYVSQYRIQAQVDADSVMRDFSEATGGTFFHNSNDLAGGLQQLGAAPEASYLLGFSPTDEKTDGKYHLLKVSLTAKNNYDVQARHGYYAVKRVENPEEKANQEIQNAVYSQDEIQDMPLEIHTKFRKTAGDTAELQVTSHLDVKDLQFRKDNGKNCNKLMVTTVIFDENGEYVSGEQKLLDLQLADDKYELVSRYGLQIQTTFALKPGSYTVREVVRELEGTEMAAKTGEVDIP